MFSLPLLLSFFLGDPMTLLITADPDYQACLAKIDQQPEQAREQALAWVDTGGGAPARHCAAMADLALKNYRLGAGRLLELADDEAAKTPLIAATLYGQAAEALLELPDEATALEAVKIGLALAPEAADLHATAGRVHLSAQRWLAAETALTKAATFQSLDGHGFASRARARLEQNKLEAATQDTLEALKLDPQFIPALIIRGELIQRGLMIDMPQPAPPPSSPPEVNQRSGLRQ